MSVYLTLFPYVQVCVCMFICVNVYMVVYILCGLYLYVDTYMHVHTSIYVFEKNMYSCVFVYVYMCVEFQAYECFC